MSERIAGLDAGADDYLVKPFEFSELWARMRAVDRRRRRSRAAGFIDTGADAEAPLGGPRRGFGGDLLGRHDLGRYPHGARQRRQQHGRTGRKRNWRHRR